MPNQYRKGNRQYQRTYNHRKNPYRQARTKTMVTGRPPTLVEKIASGVGSVATLAKAVAPVIAAINTEHKYHDFSGQIQAYNPGTNDNITLLSAISQGTDDTQRIGNSILAKDINLRISSYFTADDSTVNTVYRLTLLVWKGNANANSPTISKIYESPTNLMSAFNKDYTDQFVVLKDKIMPIDSPILPASGTAQDTGSRFIKIFKKLDFHMHWLDSTTSNTTNHIYLILRSAQGSVANTATYTVYSRLNFTDN